MKLNQTHEIIKSTSNADRKPNGSWSENLKQTMTALHVERDNIELIRCIGNGEKEWWGVMIGDKVVKS